jgi:predicted transcriptional regulator
MIRIGSPEDLHRALADLRAMSLLSQTALAAELHVNPSRIGDFEHGRRTPGTRTVIRLLTAMGWQIALVPLEES